MRSILTACLISLVAVCEGMESSSVLEDSLSLGASRVAEADTAATVKQGWFNRFLDYFNDANKNKNNKKFDFSIIGGPHYSTDTKFGVGLVAAGLYHACPSDTLLPPSNVSLFSDISTVGFYLLGIRGNHLMSGMRHRIDYKVYFYSFPSKFWGMGYENGNDDANKSNMNRWQGRVQASYLTRLARSFYLGPMAVLDYVRATKVENPLLLEGQDTRQYNVGVGFALVYDTRDAFTNAHRGMFLNIEQMFMPKIIGNRENVIGITFNASGYREVWSGGILAADMRGAFNFGKPSWAMMAQLGSSNSMRGYYEGRYRDNHKLETTLELRQHVWRRNGIVAWIGAGTVFRKFSKFDWGRILPNYGLGYRWEFKKNVNVRLDYGFGKSGQSGFLFNINEAF